MLCWKRGGETSESEDEREIGKDGESVWVYV